MNVETIVKNGQCSSCGVCVSICPRKCISLELIGKNATVTVDGNACSQCGICMSVCPFSKYKNFSSEDEIEKEIVGEYRKIECAAAKDKDLLAESGSGGVATALIAALLENKEYDSAFVVKGYGVDGLYYSERVTTPEELYDSPKSRYVTVSHEKSIAYMFSHPDEKIIFIGVSCAIKGISKCIETRGLNRNNYLLLGLFCDKSMNYGVFEYFRDHPLCKGKKITDFFFKDKKSGGWPGNVRVMFDDGFYAEISSDERISLKDYFSAEACLYCLDKLNTSCDIAMGDNYIPSNSCKEGVSSVIVRTDIGETVWNKACNRFSLKRDSEGDLLKAQAISVRIDNYSYAGFKGLTTNPPSLFKNGRLFLVYYRKMHYIKLGQKTCDNVYLSIKKQNNRRQVYWIIIRIIGFPYKFLQRIGRGKVKGEDKNE